MVNNNRLPSLSQYLRDHVDRNISLEGDGSCACPFHNEKHGKSLSIKGDVWRCFGSCQTGGDLVDLHKFNFHLKSREEAQRSLFYLYHINAAKAVTFERATVEVDEVNSYRRVMYNKALRRATDPDSWEELDYILSKVPYAVTELEMFCEAHRQS